VELRRVKAFHGAALSIERFLAGRLSPNTAMIDSPQTTAAKQVHGSSSSRWLGCFSLSDMRELPSHRRVVISVEGGRQF
jgi:hypothetical protein